MKFLFVLVTLFVCNSTAEFEDAEDSYAPVQRSLQAVGCDQGLSSKIQVEPRFNYVTRFTNRPVLSTYGRLPRVYHKSILIPILGYKAGGTRYLPSAYGAGSATAYAASQRYIVPTHGAYYQRQASHFGGFRPRRQLGLYGNNQYYGYGHKYSSGRSYDMQQSNFATFLANLLSQRKGRIILRKVMDGDDDEYDDDDDI